MKFRCKLYKFIFDIVSCVSAGTEDRWAGRTMLESRFEPGEISITSNMQKSPPFMAEGEEEPKSLLIESVKEDS